MSLKHVPLVLMLGPLAACTESSSSAAAGVTRVDSAGVPIVTSADVADTWRLSPTPSLRIGQLDGPEEYQLFEVVGARRLSDGRIAIANAGSHEVRLYGSDGAHLRSVGGEGEGPGEFLTIGRLDVSPEDSLYVWDASQIRLTVLDPSGERARDHRLETPSEGVFRYAGRFADGTLMVSVQAVPARMPEDGELYRRRDLILLYDEAGHVVDTMGSYMMPSTMIQSFDDGGAFRIYSIPFDVGTQWAISDRRLHTAYGPQFEIRTVDGTGSLARIARIARAGRRVDDDLRAAAVDDRLRRFADDTPISRLRPGYDMMPFPDSVAAYDRLLGDETGRIWARRQPLPGEKSALWDVFEATGALEAAVEIPVAATVWHLGDGWVLLSEPDELDVERVALYDLEDAALDNRGGE